MMGIIGGWYQHHLLVGFNTRLTGVLSSFSLAVFFWLFGSSWLFIKLYSPIQFVRCIWTGARKLKSDFQIEIRMIAN
ncbi:hypothetical protein L1987_66556 [Smallanthus sonchifolius]|uniref:Uncharacterized protein n=1 Tax=Smallanthus sonchifolius TaxID=185202 RepID=A0ACB9BXF7_9ASTR|nr:hypothetical protein L1987_66556 [Smallanthus sonchifolius]